MEKIKFLIIDDKRVIADMFEVTLGSKGHEITWANNYDRAVKVITEKQFDIVFLDIMIPGKDGLEILAQIKKQNKTLPVVMMSGFLLEEQKEEARKLGAVTFLKKPFEFEDIKKAIKLATGKEI